MSFALRTLLDRIWPGTPRPGAAARACRNAAVSKADAARDSGDAPAAAFFYREALDHAGPEFGLIVQLGNALKDSRLFTEAEAAYAEALALRPDDADCHLQLGHLMKLAGDMPRARIAYATAARLDPHSAAAHELRTLAPLRLVEPPATLPDEPLPVSEPPPEPLHDTHSRIFVLHRRLINGYTLRRN